MVAKKVCVITGANSGIGFEAAKEIAKAGYEVALVCRDRKKGERALKDVISNSGNKAVRLFMADLSSLAEVRSVAKLLRKSYGAIDVLINNAGAINAYRTTTKDGFETTFAVNHLAHFLLTKLLLPKLKKSRSARIINVASIAHRNGKIHFDDIMLGKGYGAYKAYRQSKLANVLFTYELARRLKGKNITVNCMHPGVVNTNFGSSYKGIIGFIFPVARLFMRNAKKGAETLVWLAISPEVEGRTGKYWVDKRDISSAPSSYDHNIQKKLWDLSAELIK